MRGFDDFKNLFEYFLRVKTILFNHDCCSKSQYFVLLQPFFKNLRNPGLVLVAGKRSSVCNELAVSADAWLIRFLRTSDKRHNFNIFF